MNSTILVFLLIIVAIFLISVAIYNTLVGKRNKVKNSWGQIEVQLKRRFDLIPNLIETVKGYAAHEKSTFDEVTSARTKFMNASSPNAAMAANDEMSRCLGKLFAVSEAYPALKANENFIDLQRELSKTEDKISFSRQFYNDVVMDYNNSVQMFPTSIFAGIFGFREETFFNVAENEREAPKVKF